jgi:hypothetical protein
MYTLVIPKRHVVDYFGMSASEVLACDELIRKLRDDLCAADSTITGFNIGMNAGNRRPNCEIERDAKDERPPIHCPVPSSTNGTTENTTSPSSAQSHSACDRPG